MAAYFLIAIILVLTALHLTVLFFKSLGTSEEPIGKFCGVVALVLWFVIGYAIFLIIK